jgi:predicted TIM-barrel fold metal-dependent hydrolase
MYDDELIGRWHRHAIGALPKFRLIDFHTHTGANDPDEFKLSAPELLAELEAVDSHAVVMPMQEPTGYPRANERVLAEAAGAGGRLIPFCRLDPKRDAIVLAKRCVEAGARGIKLHPRAEGFELSEPAVEEIFRFAHERRLPILIHAGRGIPGLARDALRLAGQYEDARIVLAHGGISDLGWLWREVQHQPNLYFDLSWWQPSDLLTLLALVPPGQLLYGSDLPYFTPTLISTLIARFGFQVGLHPRQITGILGRQAERVLAGEEPLDLGPPPGPSALAHDILLERIADWLVLAVGRMVLGDSGYEALSLARLACDLGDREAPGMAVCRSILMLLDLQEQFATENPTDGAPVYPGARSIMLAACLARTPNVTVPRIRELEPQEEFARRCSLGHRDLEETGLRPSAEEPRDLRRSSAVDHLVIDPHAGGTALTRVRRS